MLVSYGAYDRRVAVDTELIEELTEALAAARRGATTKPVSVTVPVPLADAFRLLADRGLIDSVSEATTHALEEALQAMIVGMRLDAIYEAHPETRPSEAEVAEMAERAGVSLP
jgi:Arc/MetJ-type ribon-helix-helix transcriptional regulator